MMTENYLFNKIQSITYKGPVDSIAQLPFDAVSVGDTYSITIGDTLYYYVYDGNNYLYFVI